MARKSDLPVGFEDLRGQEFKDRYAIAEVVGMTSRRVMFAGTDRQTDRPVVVRLSRPLRLHDEATLARFERRVTACGRLEHPVVEPPLDSGELFDGKLYVVSARPPGEPLDRFVAEQPEGRLTWEDARSALLGLVQALAAAHARRLVHGSVNPTCCWVERADQGLSLRLLDLGMNANPEDEDGELASSRTTIVGDDATFMAPEAAGGMLGDPRTDLYLVGLVAYFMLTGRPPFQGANAFQLASAHLQSPVPPMKELGVEVPEAVEALVRGLLAKNADERPAGMGDVEQALLGLGGHAERPPPLGGAAEPRGRRGRGRGKRGSASSREEVIQRLEGGGRGASAGRGRRLPGQEILDPGMAASPSRSATPRGMPTPVAPQPVPAPMAPQAMPRPAAPQPVARPMAPQPVARPMAPPPEPRPVAPQAVSAPPREQAPPAVPIVPRGPEPPSMPGPASMPASPSALDGQATTAFRPSESEKAALRAASKAPSMRPPPSPPEASRRPVSPGAAPGGPALGPEGTVALSRSGLAPGALGPEGTMALSRSGLPPDVLGPEGTVALSRDAQDGDGLAGTMMLGGVEGRGSTPDPGVASTMAIDSGALPSAVQASSAEPGTMLLNRSEMFGDSIPRRERGGARVVAPPSEGPPGRPQVPSGSHSVPGGAVQVPSGPYPAPGGPRQVPSGSHSVPSGSHSVPSGPAPVPGGSHSVPSGPQSMASGPYMAGARPPIASPPGPQTERRSRAGLWIAVVVLAAAAGVGVGVMLGAV